MLFAACFDLDCFSASSFPFILMLFFLTRLYMHVNQNVNKLKEYVQSLLLPFWDDAIIDVFKFVTV